jgi:hypothetical protein
MHMQNHTLQRKDADALFAPAHMLNYGFRCLNVQENKLGTCVRVEEILILCGLKNSWMLTFLSSDEMILGLISLHPSFYFCSLVFDLCRNNGGT